MKAISLIILSILVITQSQASQKIETQLTLYFLETLKTKKEVSPELVQEISKLQELNIEDPNTLNCVKCKAAIETITKMKDIKNQIEQYLVEFAQYVCEQGLDLFPDSVCKGAIAEMKPFVFDSLWDHYISVDFLCPTLNMCESIYEPVDMDSLVQEILKDKPQKPQLVPNLKNTIKFLHISDVHSGKDYDPKFNAKCGDPDCCIPSAGLAQSDADKGGYWGTLNASCDIPERTFEKLVDFVAKYFADDLNFGIWTGDNTSHAIWEQSFQSNLDNTKVQTEYIKKTLKNSQIYPIQGNHESFPVNQYDFQVGKEKEFNEFFAQQWGDWIGDDAVSMMKESGYYITVVKEYNLKIIALNTQAGSQGNFTLMRNPTDPANILQKIRQALAESEANDQPVYIIGHIPTGSGMTYDYSIVLNALFDRYSYTIRGIFMGHTHNDQIQITYDSNKKPVAVNWIAPSVTTYTHKNPSFRILEADAVTMQIVNIHQYRMDLDYWNQFTDPNTEITFEHAYDFLTEYNLENMWDLNNVDTLRNQIKSDLDTYNKYVFNYHSGNYAKQNSINEHYYCGMLSNGKDQATCEGNKYEPSIIEVLGGPWIQKIKKQDAEEIEEIEL